MEHDELNIALPANTTDATANTSLAPTIPKRKKMRQQISTPVKEEPVDEDRQKTKKPKKVGKKGY